MRESKNHTGIFTPEELQQMQNEFDKDAPRFENQVDRENRALAVVLGVKSSKSRKPGKKLVGSGDS